MHRYQTNKPRSGANAPFKPPGPSNSAATAGSPFSVPATHGSSQQDRTDASTSRASAWPNNGPQGGSNYQGGYNNYNRSTSSSYGRQQDSAWDSRDSGGSDSFGYRPSSNKVVGMIDDFDDSVDKPNGVDKYGIDRKREAARQRDAPKSVVSPGKAQRKAAADYEDRLDNLHSYENNVREQRLAEDRKIKEKKEQQSKLKAAADEAKARALLRNSPEAQRNVSALPSSRRPSASSSANAQRKPATYSKKDKQRDRSASAAEERRRKERGETDEIEDADEESDGIEVMQSSKKGGKDAKGKGKQKEADVEMSSSERSKSHRAPPKKLPPVDIDALLKPNMPVSKSSSGRVSSPPRSSQAKTINLADSPEKPRAAKPAPPAFEMSPSPEPVDLNALIKKEREEEQKRADKEEAKAEKRREKEKKRIVLSPDEEEDAEDSEEAVRRELMEGSPRGRFSRTPDPLLWAEETRADPSTLCPFCSRALPATRSSTLSNLLEYLLARPDIVDYPTARNPGGKRLPVVQTASFCRLHEEEMVVIPKGIEKGWPTEIDWDGLPKRIDRQLSQHLSDIITGKTPSPFFEDAKKEWEAKGNKMKNLLSEYASFDVEQPGYYGSRGHELIVATVTRLFVTQTPLLAPFRCTPLDPAAYIRRVLVPETATQLIKADLFLPDDESAREVLRESRAFGRAM
ncbi:hypothetical protein BCR35DRAFT_184746 [Leucosporidium creatinivorum]|uniref:Restriction of telomere capping protein 4 n=1 Tax=Leucosporidium creatinivorum TaxID=106004 RepID=A0A1Y2E049_9BASI|nr:hypothetical protein BCR35DRAFT_184746 [Leucosporidium creatinivorum]